MKWLHNNLKINRPSGDRTRDIASHLSRSIVVNCVWIDSVARDLHMSPVLSQLVLLIFISLCFHFIYIVLLVTSNQPEVLPL